LFRFCRRRAAFYAAAIHVFSEAISHKQSARKQRAIFSPWREPSGFIQSNFAEAGKIPEMVKAN
jgi:hypothetical protein